MPATRQRRRPAATRILGLGHYRPANVGHQRRPHRARRRHRRRVDPDPGRHRRAALGRPGRDRRRHGRGGRQQGAGRQRRVAPTTSTSSSSPPARCPTPVPARRAAARPPARHRRARAPSTSTPAAPGFCYALGAARRRSGPARRATCSSSASERFTGWHRPDRPHAPASSSPTARAPPWSAPSDEPGIGPVVWGSDGDAVRRGRASTQQTRFFRQEGQAVYRWATTQMAPVALEACRARRRRRRPSIAAFVPHQANLRIIDAIAKRLGVAERRRRARHRRRPATPRRRRSRSRCRAWSRRGEIPSGAPVLLLGFGVRPGLRRPGRARAREPSRSAVPADAPIRTNRKEDRTWPAPRRSAPDSPRSSKRSPT